MYRPLDHPLLHRLREQVLFSAGPIGSTLLSYNLNEDAFVAADGETHDGCPEWLNVSRPDILQKLYRSFYEVGVDAVDSCSFGANEVVLAEFDLADRTRELNRLAAQVIGSVRDEFSTPEHPRYAFGTMGPGTKLPSLGHITWDELVRGGREQAIGLIEGGIDVLKVETCQDLLQTKAVLAGCAEAFEITGKRIPVIASVTIETTGTMLLGSDIACALTTLEPLDIIDIIGINCATGPEQMVEHVRYLAEHCRRPVFIGPNAGLPEVVDGQACYTLTPEQFAKHQSVFVGEFGTNIAAGCCGTTPEMFATAIAALGRRAPKFRPAAAEFLGAGESPYEANVSSLYTSVPLEQETSFLVIGERTNATGSRAFRDILLAGDLDGVVAVAREQAAEGAHVLDVSVDYVGRDGTVDMEQVATALRTQSTLPLVFDSTEVAVVETALKLYGGKAIINSINLEDGERKIRKLLPLIKRHGAAAIALTIDEEGQARTTEWKLRVARRIYDLAVGEYGVEPGDLLFDFLTFTLSGGQEDLRKDGMETLNAIKAVKAEFPGVHTTLGVSNVSFGLKPAARRVLNSVFLAEAIEHGLDSAIVNAKQIVPLNRIPDEQQSTARDLIYDRRREDYDPLHHFISLFENVTEAKEAKPDRSLLPVEERLKQRIVDGDRKGLETDLDEALSQYDPLVIINEHLLDGMRVVGELFGSGKMQLPFVLQSAETMKQSVSYLEPHMDKVAGSTKGKIVLATVSGDVHDIGKNLVDIILSNNGYTTYNIGIKQPIHNIIEKAQEVEADAIGLSGLLVKSTVVMRENLEELNSRELFRYPVILGGAALTRRYVEDDLRRVYKGTVYYAQDAFEGLSTLDKVMPALRAGTALPVLTRGGVEVPADSVYDPVLVSAGGGGGSGPGTHEYARSETKRGVPIPTPPFWGSRVVRGIPLNEIFPWINEIQLFRGQWQYQRGERDESDYQAFVDAEVRPVFRQWSDTAIKDQLLTPQVVYGYFPCLADRNDLVCWPDVIDGKPAGEPIRLTYPRQATGERKCIADFFRSFDEAAEGGPQFDVVGMSLVTMGPKASEFAQKLFAANEYRDYLHWHGFSVESAEALAELWHARMRKELGIDGRDGPDHASLFKAVYQGARYSFGYPACPDLEEQTKMATLLQPERIGVELSETFQWHPEQSTSAVIVHHPEARYFVVK